MYRQRKGVNLKGRYCDSCNVFYPSHRTGWIAECPACFSPLKKPTGVAKYHNKKVEWKGKMIDSKKECNEVIDVDYLLKAGEIRSYRTQVNFPIYVNGLLITRYVADIVIEHNDDTIEVREVKSKFTNRFETWRIKRNLFEATYIKENPTWRFSVVV